MAAVPAEPEQVAAALVEAGAQARVEVGREGGGGIHALARRLVGVRAAATQQQQLRQHHVSPGLEIDRVGAIAVELQAEPPARGGGGLDLRREPAISAGRDVATWHQLAEQPRALAVAARLERDAQ